MADLPGGRLVSGRASAAVMRRQASGPAAVSLRRASAACLDAVFQGRGLQPAPPDPPSGWLPGVQRRHRRLLHRPGRPRPRSVGGSARGHRVLPPGDRTCRCRSDSGGGLIRNAFTRRRVAWSDIASFQLADKRAMGVLPAESVTCLLRSGECIPVRAAGTWIQGAGAYAPSGTSHSTLSLIAQELNVRMHQHRQRSQLDQWPSL